MDPVVHYTLCNALPGDDLTVVTANTKQSIDRLAAEVDEYPGAYKEQDCELQQILSDENLEPTDRARALRLKGVALNRQGLYRDALATLGEAQRIAIDAHDYRELANIERETAVIYSWRGDDRAAALHLVHALAYGHLEGDEAGAARSIAELGRIELECRRYATAVRVLRLVATQDPQHLKKRQVQRAKVSLCQALNQLGQHDEVLEWSRELKAELPPGERLLFLTRLEEVRALVGLDQLEAAELALDETRKLMSQNAITFEQAEYAETASILAAKKGGPSVEEGLAATAAKFDEQDLVVRAAEIRIQLARHLVKASKADEARTLLGWVLRSAISADNLELAERLRSEMLKSSGVGQTSELADEVNSIAGGATLNRRFILLKRIGQGGFAIVHKALDLRDGQEVALKRISLDAIYSPVRREELAASIRNEYGAAIKLPSHPGIARLRDILMDPGGSLFVVQDYVSGPCLRELYDSGPEPKQIMPLLADLADTLAVLHAKQIVHRDLKPENVIIGEKGPVLIDFGIALLVGTRDMFKHYGSADYMSPEQAKGEAVDARSDTYSLGKMVAEAWAGRFSGRVSFFAALWSKQRFGTMPRQLGLIVQQMLAERAEDRPSALGPIAETLRQWEQL